MSLTSFYPKVAAARQPAGQARRRRVFRLNCRSSGILAHVSSLPGRHGCGDFGPETRRFVDFLAEAGQGWWQMLPVGPPDSPGNSPYNSSSAFAGSPWFVSLEELAEEGLLRARELEPARPFNPTRVEYPRMKRFRESRLRRAFERFARRHDEELEQFRHENREWLENYCLFSALRAAYERVAWNSWPKSIRHREPRAIAEARQRFAREIAFEEFVQFQFDRQWNRLRDYAHERGVGMIGDIPIFVAYDSSDVWAHRELFELDRHGKPRAVSGCPPDDFTPDGQLWGHPQYDWDEHRRTGFAWWVQRFGLMTRRFDAVRFDHFLGVYRVWAIPPRAKTARPGRWVPGPGAALFDAVRKKLGAVQIIAEDLGAVTPQALALRNRLRLPGMRVMQFAFGPGGEYHLPDKAPQRCVAYTATHDNDTSAGWFSDCNGVERRTARSYLGCRNGTVHWPMIKALMSSPADTVIIPMQDVLGLGRSARMNVPGTARGNWQWRFEFSQIRDAARRLLKLAEASGRI